MTEDQKKKMLAGFTKPVRDDFDEDYWTEDEEVSY